MKKELKVNNLIQKRNQIEAEIATVRNKISTDNTVLLFAEILNLIDGVGEYFISKDSYAESRYYSSIEGVKNIRLGRLKDGVQTILVKVTSPVGELLPREFELKGIKYSVVFMESKNYSRELDY